MAIGNVFAIFYVVAQVIERILEFIKNSSGVYDETRANIRTIEMRIEDQKKIIEKAREAGEDLESHYEKLNELLKAKNKMDNKMVIDFFIYSSGLGILVCWLLHVRFLTLLEVSVHPWLDTVITGLVVGSGTKPLHDLIKYIEKAKS
jgi:uncharacterized protein YqgV (UPF0045/DUF77 family)